MLPFTNISLLINALLRVIIATLILLVCFRATRRRSELKVYKYLGNFFLALIFWDGLSALYYTTADASSLPLLDNLIHVSITFSAYTFFIFCATCYNNFKEIPYLIRLLVGLFPLANAAVLLTYPLHNWGLIDCLQYDYDTPFRINNYNWGFWFQINIIYLNGTALLGSFLLWVKYFKKSSSNRKTYFLLAFFATIAPASSIVTSWTTNGVYQLATCFLHCTCPLAFYFIMIKEKKLTLEYVNKINIQSDTLIPTLLLNNEDQIMIFNQAAVTFFEKYQKQIIEGIKVQEMVYPSLMLKLGSEKPIQNQEIVYLQDKKTRELIIAKKKILFDKRNKKLGTALTFEFVQVLDQIIEHLEKYAFYDTLCHCNTRALYEKQSPTLLREAQYPVCFFIADVDNLKQVNDHLGHKMGDRYIQKSSKILQETFPSQCHFYRIGGDEFFIFCSQMEETEAEKIIKKINKKCQLQKTVHCFNISVGYSVLQKAPLPPKMKEVFNQHFQKADKMMYANKHICTKELPSP